VQSGMPTLAVAPGLSGTAQVNFTLKSKNNSGEQQVYNFYVDPRMWW
jgi:hypothetical protein